MEKAREMLPRFKEEIANLNRLYQKNSTGKRQDAKLISGIKIRLKQIWGKISKLGKNYNVVIVQYELDSHRTYMFFTNLHIEDSKAVFKKTLNDMGISMSRVKDVKTKEVVPGKPLSSSK